MTFLLKKVGRNAFHTVNKYLKKVNFLSTSSLEGCRFVPFCVLTTSFTCRYLDVVSEKHRRDYYIFYMLANCEGRFGRLLWFRCCVTVAGEPGSSAQKLVHTLQGLSYIPAACNSVVKKSVFSSACHFILHLDKHLFLYCFSCWRLLC